MKQNDLSVDIEVLQVALIIFSAVSLATLEFIKNVFPNTDLVPVSKSVVVYMIVLVQVLPALVLLAADRLIAARYGSGRRLRVFRSVLFAAALLLILRQLQLYWGPATDFADSVRSASLVLLVFVDLLIVAAIVCLAIWAFKGLLKFFYYMSPVAIAMTAIISFQMPTSANLPEGYAQEVETATESGSRPAVFILVFDELGYNVLLEQDDKPQGELFPRDGELDEESFPNIAGLARDGVWFTNATTCCLNSLAAVPRLVDPAVSLAQQFDVRLYTQYFELEKRYFDDCGKVITCRGVTYLAENDRLRLAGSLALRAFYQAAPKPVEKAINRPMGWLLDRLGWAYPPTDRAGIHTFTKRQFGLFLDDIEGENALGRIYVSHLLLPHDPFSFDRKGNAVNRSATLFRPEPDQGSAVTDPAVYREHVMYVDRLIGELVSKLKREGIYDESVIVISGDHGPRTFIPTPGRAPTEFMPRVPLVIHAPGLRRQVSSVDYQHTDFGATLTDILGLPTPEDAEGVSAFSEERPQRDKVLRVNNSTFIYDREVGSWQLWPPDGLVLKGSSDAIYVAQGGLRRNVLNAASLEAYGHQWGNVEQIDDQELGGIAIGTPLLDVLADGNLLRGSGGATYVMEGRAKRPLTSTGVMDRCGYSEDAVYAISDAVLGAIPTGVGVSGSPCPHLSLPGGTLVKGDDRAYVIDGGFKRHIAGPGVMPKCGYLWGNVNLIADSSLTAIPTGDDVTGEPCP